ncbi:MAG: hypothetical protein OXP69_25275 [Spirochaetaceae bacterium]|nr:hypothetical protein [Spirochaetaceae bacterium]
MIEVVWIATAVGNVESRSLPSTGTADWLCVVERLRRYVAHEHSFQIAQVDSHLERGRRAQQVNVATLEKLLTLRRRVRVGALGALRLQGQVGRRIQRRRAAQAEAARAGDDYLAVYNANPRPFIWTKSPDQILDSVKKYCERISDA